MTPRPRRWRSSPPPARRSTICRCLARPRPSTIPASRARLCLGPKTVLAEFGALHPGVAKAFDLDGPVVAAEIFLDAIPQKRGRRPHAQRLCAAAAPGGDARLRLPRPRRAAGRRAAPRGQGRRQGGDRRRRACSTSSPGRASPEGQKSLAIEVTLQPGEKSFTDEELKAISERIVAAAAKLGATLRA